MQFRGLDLVRPLNRMAAGKASMAVNVRAYIKEGLTLRNPLSSAILTIGMTINSLARLNDSTPAGPVSGYTIITAAGNQLFNNTTSIATGLSGNPVSMVPFRPNASVQPWMYIADSAPQGNVTIHTKYLTTGANVDFVTNGMLKVRSDGLIYKMGIKEPQNAPAVSTSGTTTTGTASLPATTIPWTNVGGVNPSYNYGHTSVGDGTAPVVISTPVGAQTLQITVTGSATVNGATHVPGDSGPVTSTYPGQFAGGHTAIVMGAFTDGSGNVLTGTSPVPLVASVGGSVLLQVPAGALNFQIGIDSSANTFSANSGSFSVAWTLTTSAIATKVSTLGNVTAYAWGDSPHSGGVASYLWKNPNDSGTGLPRTIADASVTATNNSWIFDSTPEDGTVPVQWSTLDSSGTTTGSIPLFTPAFETEGYQDFNCCIVGSLFFPAAGTYLITLQYKDQIMLGIGGGVTTAYSSGSTGLTQGTSGQTISVVNSLPLQFVSIANGGGTFKTTTLAVTVNGTGTYQFELDWDYWQHTGRSLIMSLNGQPIPPLPQGVRTNVSYGYTYRSSATGAVSNPSPFSPQQLTPVLDNTVSSTWSNDPQVDLVDYYRQDAGLANYTYVATGPNDGIATGTNTPIVDALSDLAAASNPTLEFDNYEPVPSIDLPQKGTCNVSGNVITWVSGGSIGGSETGFNLRWLAGTVIEIGTPTSLAYSAVRRPTSTTVWDFSDATDSIPDGTNLQYVISEPILANQPIPYVWGPTDNVNYAYGVGDPLRPGTLYWCKGSNLDAWPDTNQQDVTDPSEPLVNGCMSAGLGVLASIKRVWAVAPNFFNALATATGTQGSTWSLRNRAINRGLYMQWAIAVEGGGSLFFRVDDGIHASIGGGASQSITDDDLYPLFPHENDDGSTTHPQPITRNGYTIYPPDDTQPNKQKLYIQNAYLYWVYIGTDGNWRTLTFDIAAMGWIWDILTPTATAYTANEGLNTQGVLVGCSDGTVRQVTAGGSESVTGTVVSAAIGGKGWTHCGEIVLEYSSSASFTLTGISVDSENGSYGFSAITIPSSGGQITKLFLRPVANKWKLMQFQFTLTSPVQLYFDGCVAYCKSWGSDGGYSPVQMFGSAGGEG